MQTRHSLQKPKDAPTVSQIHASANRQVPEPLTPPTHPTALIQRAMATLGVLNRSEVLQLQRTIGNRAVGGLTSGRRKMIPTKGLSRELLATRSADLVMQAKMIIGELNDQYEREADRVAQGVVQQIQSPQQPKTEPNAMMQRQAEEGAELRRQSDSLLPGGMKIGGDLEETIRQAQKGGQPLEDGLRSQMEQGFGAHFGQVRVHNDSEAHMLNRTVGSAAFTVGAHIFLGTNHSQNEIPLVAHELAHTIQQGACAPIAGSRQAVNGQPPHGEVTRIQREVYVRDKPVKWPAQPGSPIDQLIKELTEKKESALLKYLMEALTSEEKDIQLDSLSFAELQRTALEAGIQSQPTGNITKIKKPEKEKKAYKDIPNIIHFIWAGGAKLLPDKNTKVIKSWMAANPDGRVYLWIDQETAPGGINLKAHYQQQFADIMGGKLTVMDITEQGVVRPHSRYEIDRMRPNYGASSDLLRYRILEKFGGAYFDSDVEPGTMSVSAGIEHAKKQKTGFFVTGYTQGLEAVGNDAYLAAKGSPYMKALAETAEKRYERQYGGSEAKYFDEADMIKQSTIWRTGPEASSQMLFEQGLLIPSEGEEHGKQIVRPEDSERSYFNQPPPNMTLPRNLVKHVGEEESPDTNDRSWLGMPVKATKSLDEAWTIVEKSIRFEVEVMEQLRLRTHLRNMKESIERGTKSKLKAPFHEVLWAVICNLSEANNDGSIDFSNVKFSDSPKKTTDFTGYLTELLKEPSLW